MMQFFKSILIVEDDAEIRETLQDILEHEGYSTKTAENGKIAIEMLENLERPCLILLDLMMPVMNGWEFLKYRRKDDVLATIPVVIVTAAGGTAANVSSDDVAGTLKKPLNLETLLDSVKAYCDHPPCTIEENRKFA